MSLKVVAFDPGITTGYAVGILDAGEMRVKYGQQKWRHLEMWEELQRSNPDFIIWEKFVFRKNWDKKHEGVELYPRELIGIFHLYVQVKQKERGPNSIVAFEQMPMKGGSYFSDNQLKKDGLYGVGKPHSRDAVRHICHWFTFGAGYKYNTAGIKPL